MFHKYKRGGEKNEKNICNESCLFFCYFVLKDEVHQDSIEAYKLILGGGI